MTVGEYQRRRGAKHSRKGGRLGNKSADGAYNVNVIVIF